MVGLSLKFNNIKAIQGRMFKFDTHVVLYRLFNISKIQDIGLFFR